MNGNPFHRLGAIDQVEHLYDRRSEVRDALSLLLSKQNVEVTGPRKIGKTSFLHHISHPDILREYGMDPRRNLFVYIDCRDRLIQGEKLQVYQVLLDRVTDVARRADIDSVPESSGESTARTAFEQVLKEVSHRGLRTVLLLDNFEAMAGNSRLGDTFFNSLRSLCGAGDIDVVYVTASSACLAELCVDRELSSPFFNIFRRIPLRLFNEQDSQHLVEDSLRWAGTSFPRDLLELVLEVGGGHPYFLQMAGYYAFELVVTGGAELAEDRRQKFLDAINAEATEYFRSYWEKLNGQQQYILAALPLVWEDLIYRETIEYLREQCLIARRNGRYEYFSPLLEAFIRQQRVDDLLQTGILLLDQRRHQVLLRGKPLSLSPTSYALLACLMQQPDQVVSNEQLWQAARSEEPYDAEQLKYSIRSLLKVLGDDADYIAHERNVGYIFQQPRSSGRADLG